MGDTQEIDALEEIDAAIADAECEQMEQDIIATLQLAKAEITRLRSELTMWHGKVGEFAKAFEAQRSELERAREDLQSSFLCVFLDGRNEHGSHVLEMPGSNMDPDDVKDIIATLEDQSLGFAEQIITEAESLGHEVGHCVVTIWDLTRDPEWGVECEYRRISPVLTNLMCGSPEAQREVLASSPPVPEQKD